MRLSTEEIINNKALRAIRRKKGSSAVMLAIIFLGFAICVAGAAEVSRRLTASSECEIFGRLWTKAILSEYDIHLLEDYSIMAYFGNDSDVTGKLDSYLKYSMTGRLGRSVKGVNADLTGYELGDPDNFRKALRLGFAESAVSELLNGRGRIYRELDTGEGFDEEGQVINNPVVLATLPSHGAVGSVSADSLKEKAEIIGDENKLIGMMKDSGAEILMIEKSFNNHVTTNDDKNHLLVNEWEYIIKGSPDDEKNYRSCRRMLFLARNALNLAAIHNDPVKTELIMTLAETISPGPLGLATQALITEAWAALETEEDLDDLYHDRRVPVLKEPGEWKTDISAVFGSSEIREKLDEGSKELLDEKKDEISEMVGKTRTVSRFSDGLNYDEYLMVMILSMNEKTRLLRIMDLVQINMKYRYYSDFNMMEYYTGVRFSIETSGKDHEFEDAYK